MAGLSAPSDLGGSGVIVGVGVGVGVIVDVAVAVAVGVSVDAAVAVAVGVSVGVSVGVAVAGAEVAVAVGVNGVGVAVGVHAANMELIPPAASNCRNSRREIPAGCALFHKKSGCSSTNLSDIVSSPSAVCVKI